MPGLLGSSIPEGAIAIQDFDYKRYLGKWYEIARLDFKFEANMNNTTAEYSLNHNGTIRIENKGYNFVKNRWQKAIGKAKFRRLSSIAELKVSFFGPFYAGYNVIMLDAEYKYALVVGKDLRYLWILSREKSIPSQIKDQYLSKAETIGFKISHLIWVEQSMEA